MGIAAVVLFIILSNIWIVNSSDGKIHTSISDLPKVDTVIVFGTSQYKLGGGANPFFDARIKAAANLYHSKKASTLILSGSRDKSYYNEPKAMRASLMKLNVPAQAILMDTLGIRSFDTILRGKNVYKVNSTIFVTQEYHAHRVLFIAERFGIKALCFAAEFPESNFSNKVVIREFLARPKAIMDLYLTY